MNVFEEVKQNVTVRQAAELYGFKPNRSGLIRCIFHNDGTPSMKVDRRYYCFGCGCTGDVIDFTAQLFGLKSREAALKLADDFGISYGNRARDSPKSGKKSLVKERGKVSETDWKTECARLTKAYLEMPESLSGLSEPASGMERMLCTKNTRGRVGWAFWHRTEGVEYR